MSGNMWIILGVTTLAISSFAIPYGFYKKSKEEDKIESINSATINNLNDVNTYNQKEKQSIKTELGENEIILHFNNSGLNFVLKKDIEKAIESFCNAKNRSRIPKQNEEIIKYLENRKLNLNDSVYQNTELVWHEIYEFFLREHSELLDENYLKRFNRAIESP
jgi:hypothetical protein